MKLLRRAGRHTTLAAALTAAVGLMSNGCASAPKDGDGGTAPATGPVSVAPAANADGRMLGAADAPVTVIEFTDLQCPYCARFARDTWPALRARYVDTGKVRFASRDFPLPFHRFAVPAAVAARCAERQGRYWEFREQVFKHQAELGSEPYSKLAQSVGLDGAQLDACRADPAVQAAVQADVALGESNGISGTPTFVIGRRVDGKFEGEMLTGAQSIDAFSARIDALLSASQQTQP
jgi:protein-disulfide isomerase